MPEQKPEHTGTIQKSNAVVTEYAETQMREAAEKIDEALARRKGMNPAAAKEIVREYNEWNEFVRPQSPDDRFYEVRVRGGKAKVIPSSE